MKMKAKKSNGGIQKEWKAERGEAYKERHQGWEL